MIDIKLVENDFEAVQENLHRRNASDELLLRLRDAALKNKAQKRAYEDARAEQNKLSKDFGALKAQKKDTSALQGDLARIKAAVQEAEIKAKECALELEQILLEVPNMLDETTPIGKDENDNVEIKKILTPPVFGFTPRAHYELGEALGWLDFNAGVKLAKARFTVMKKEAAKLERALINYMLDFNASRGFSEIWLPSVVNRAMMQGSGQLPKFENDLFKIEGSEGLFLIPTAEVPLVNLYNDTIIPAGELPIKLTAYTSCFRKEAGSAGRDTRGIMRQHQFDKVELVSFCEPADSDKIFDEMLSCASDLLSSLGLAHRLVRLCSGDIGFSARKTVDIEVWIPSENKYREISSVSNVGDFQSRRAKIRYKKDGKNALLHTLNGSSLAVGRTLIAIMENFQNEDGSVNIPPALLKYL
ncbi:MAG: serine--tRNA ligase [Helicobacteraceae bacterium]